jgi:hypothetical protein
MTSHQKKDERGGQQIGLAPLLLANGLGATFFTPAAKRSCCRWRHIAHEVDFAIQMVVGRYRSTVVRKLQRMGEVRKEGWERHEAEIR